MDLPRIVFLFVLLFSHDDVLVSRGITVLAASEDCVIGVTEDEGPRVTLGGSTRESLSSHEDALKGERKL
jgi:hypothetical protein